MRSKFSPRQVMIGDNYRVTIAVITENSAASCAHRAHLIRARPLGSPARRIARQRDVLCTRTAGGGFEFDLPPRERIKLLSAVGFVIDALHELYAPLDASEHPYYGLATAR